MTTQSSLALMGDCHWLRLGICHPHTTLFGNDGALEPPPVLVLKPNQPQMPPRRNLESSRRPAPQRLCQPPLTGKGETASLQNRSCDHEPALPATRSAPAKYALNGYLQCFPNRPSRMK